MMPENVTEAARRVIAMRDACAPVTRLPDALRPADQVEAYAIQSEVIRLRAAAGQALGGWKVGCTTAASQKSVGVDGPCSGAALAGNILASPARVDRERTVRPRAECEIAVRLASDIPARDGGHTADSVAPHVGACMAAIEHCESRFAETEGLGAPDYIADDFFQKGIVLGPDVTDWQRLDLAALHGVLTIDGVVRGEGHGRDVMGHPFAALAWLADNLASRGLTLRAGDVVLTGSLAPAVSLERGQTAVATVDGLGSCELAIV